MKVQENLLDFQRNVDFPKDHLQPQTVFSENMNMILTFKKKMNFNRLDIFIVSIRRRKMAWRCVHISLTVENDSCERLTQALVECAINI